MNNLNHKILSDMPVPLPPLAEQKRIVAKIEELLPLVDRYAVAYEKLEQFNGNLMRASVELAKDWRMDKMLRRLEVDWAAEGYDDDAMRGLAELVMRVWLSFLQYILWPLFVVLVALMVFFTFTMLANIIAAPFNGLLAEQLEARLTGATPPDTGVLGIMKDVPRIMKREWQKLAWYLPRAVVLLLLYFIPGIGQTVAPVLWFLFSAWMLAIQYCDYPFDNHKVSFKTMREALRTRKVTNMQFGALASLFTLIPVLNLVIIPVAICGATAMWVDCYRDKHAMWK